LRYGVHYSHSLNQRTYSRDKLSEVRRKKGVNKQSVFLAALNDKQRDEEIARMLVGGKIIEITRKHAAKTLGIKT
jgi:DNA repair ATPase RecN